MAVTFDVVWEWLGLELPGKHWAHLETDKTNAFDLTPKMPKSKFLNSDCHSNYSSIFFWVLSKWYVFTWLCNTQLIILGEQARKRQMIFASKKFGSQCRLCILTSKRVLRKSFAGWNYFFVAKTTFSVCLGQVWTQKQMIWTSERHMEHPVASQNTQRVSNHWLRSKKTASQQEDTLNV